MTSSSPALFLFSLSFSRERTTDRPIGPGRCRGGGKRRLSGSQVTNRWESLHLLCGASARPQSEGKGGAESAAKALRVVVVVYRMMTYGNSRVDQVMRFPSLSFPFLPGRQCNRNQTSTSTSTTRVYSSDSVQVYSGLFYSIRSNPIQPD